MIAVCGYFRRITDLDCKENQDMTETKDGAGDPLEDSVRIVREEAIL